MRSTLYVPGDRPERFAKALASGADGVILDLEDAVAPSSKAKARHDVCTYLSGLRSATPESEERPAVFVRVNQGALGADDAAAVLAAGGAVVQALYVPKVSTIEDVMNIDQVVDRAEATNRLAAMSIGIVALLETATGVFNALTIASHARVKRLALGEADLAAELGVELTPGDERELLTARSLVVMASAAAAIDAPMGPVSVSFKDHDALRVSSEALRRMGFRGRSAIHPAQVEVINAVFTPTVEQLRRAERLVELYDAALADGRGAVADDNGKMIDEAVVRSARRVVAQRHLIG
jgi:citrate lyase subunit beta / citryl-CoA lyase